MRRQAPMLNAGFRRPLVSTIAAIAMALVLMMGVLMIRKSHNSVDQLLVDDPQVRQQVVSALKGPAMEDAVRALVARLDDDRYADKAARALIDIGQPVVPILCESINRPLLLPRTGSFDLDIKERRHDAEMRLRAINVLTVVASPESIPALLHILSYRGDSTLSYDYDVLVPAATRALVEIGPPAVSALLVAYHGETDAMASSAIYDILLRISDRDGGKSVMEALWNPQTTKGAVRFLAATRRAEAVDALVTLLRAESTCPRYDVAWALTVIGGDKAKGAVSAFATSVDIGALKQRYNALLAKNDEESTDMLLFLFVTCPTGEMAKAFISSDNTWLIQAASVWSETRTGTGNTDR